MSNEKDIDKEKQKFDFYRLKGQLQHDLMQTLNKIFAERQLKLYQKQLKLQERQNKPPQNKLALDVARIELQLNEKIVQINQRLEFLQHKQKENRQLTELFKLKVSNMMDSVQSTQKELHNEVLTVTNFLQEQKVQFQKMFNRFQTDLKSQTNNWNHTFNNANERWNQLEFRYGQIEIFRNKQELLNQQSSSNILKMLEEQTRFESTLKRQEAIFKLSQKNYELIIKLERYTQDTSAKLNQLQNFIQKYEPIYSYAQLSETLFYVLGDKYRERIEQRDRKVLADFTNLTSIDNGVANLKKKVLKYRQVIEAIILRNKPYERTIQKKVNSDAMSQQQKIEQKLRNYISEQIKKIDKKINLVESNLKTEFTEQIKQHNLDVNQIQQISELKFNKIQDKIAQLQQKITNKNIILMEQSQHNINTPHNHYNRTSHNNHNSNNISQNKNFQSPNSKEIFAQISKKLKQHNSNYINYSNRETQKYSYEKPKTTAINQQSKTHRHQSDEKIQNIATSCLIPQSMWEYRRKSLIEMRRNKVQKANFQKD